MNNPVAKNNKNRGGPHKRRDKEGRKHVAEKLRKELLEVDERWIDEEIDAYYYGIDELINEKE